MYRMWGLYCSEEGYVWVSVIWAVLVLFVLLLWHFLLYLDQVLIFQQGGELNTSRRRSVPSFTKSNQEDR